ncbi:MAG: phytanoyl-CoA dioxygenase family protein [Steroidobacteraceae bacterium]
MTEPFPSIRASEPGAAAGAPGLPAALDLLRASGYVIFERLLPDATVERLNAELDPWFSATPRCQGDFYGWSTTRFGSVLLKSPASHALALHPVILSLLDAVLGPHCDWYQLNLTQAVRLHPGERRQVPHRDEEMWPCPKSGIEYLVNVMWALSDFTARNGATVLWPRSHFARLSRELDLAQATVAAMPRGSALVYLGSLTHCAGANRSDRPRTGLILSYCLGWLKQYENAFLSYPPAVARQFPPALRDLLGYRIHRPNLGGYEGQDPAVLFETASHSLPAVDALPADTVRELREFYAREPREAGEVP